jgi:hypothetical protein
MKTIKATLALMLIFFISVSLVSGLQLSASTGSDKGTSSTEVTYGATLDDYAEQHIGLNPGEATLANAYYGSGSLPGASISKTDSKGNYVYAYRSVSGASGVTSWNYDWNTYTPYSSTAGYGVGAQLWLTAGKAYSITGRGKSSNAEGDSAEASMTVGSSSPSLTSYLSNYYVNPTAFTNEVGVYQSASSASSTGPITILGTSNNRESDYTKTTITTTTGTISNPTTNVYAAKTRSWSYPTASLISTTGTGTLSAEASSQLEKDTSKFNLKVINGKITSANFYGDSGTGISERTWASISSAYGSTTEVSSQATNKARATSGSSYTLNGQADFIARKTNNAAFSNIVLDTKSTAELLDITATGFPKTALLLEPFRAFGFGNIYSSVGSTLADKGYAVTDYSNAGVTWDKVYQLDQHTVSVINTHGVVDSTTAKNPNTVGLAISYDPSGTGSGTQKSWTQLQPYLKTSNDMIILSACDPFNTNSYMTTFGDGTKTYTPGRYTVSKAQASGGFVGSVLIADTKPFLDKFFSSLASGYTVSQANTLASSSIGNRQKLTLQGNTAYKLR